MAPLLEGRPLSDIIFADRDDPAAIAQAEEELRRTEITQPAVITVDVALTRLLAEYGITPDMVMGHSVGEYGALVARRCDVVRRRDRSGQCARPRDGRHRRRRPGPDGRRDRTAGRSRGASSRRSTATSCWRTSTRCTRSSSAARAPRSSRPSPSSSAAVTPRFRCPVSHAFHTEIVASASVPLRSMLKRLGLRTPQLPVVANVNGEFYPTDGDVAAQMVDMLSRQVASPGAVCQGPADPLRRRRARVRRGRSEARAPGLRVGRARRRHRPQPRHATIRRPGDIATFNSALCGLWAAGVGAGTRARRPVRGRRAQERRHRAAAGDRGGASARAPARAATRPHRPSL